MPKVLTKTFLETINGTPKKRFFLSIISDYDLKTGLCELIDNALDLWITNGGTDNITISVMLDQDRQFIEIKDNAGGIHHEQAELLISPGASRNDVGESLIGIFGVGGKRAAIALGELVEIRTRQIKGKSFQVDLTSEWVASPSWDLDIYQIPDLEKGTTTVSITKVRQSFDEDDIKKFRQHVAETYKWFIDHGCKIIINNEIVFSISFDKWAYPPDFLPRTASFTIEPSQKRFLKVDLTAGLILDRDPEADNYGVYVFCNNRLILKELKSRDVGYFITSEAGVPHPDASLSRTIIEFYGAAELMPWNSSKNGINFNHPSFLHVRSRVIDFASYYSKASRRFKNDWENNVFKYKNGRIISVDQKDAASNKKRVLPKIPSVRSLSRIDVLRNSNKAVILKMPWTIGLVEAMSLVDLIGKQNLETRNRAALILLDSNFEIALKEFIVSRVDLFPPHVYKNSHLSAILGSRTSAVKEIQKHINLSQLILQKVNYYYALRNSLIHERATVLITDSQVSDYQAVVEAVLQKLFTLKFPKA